MVGSVTIECEVTCGEGVLGQFAQFRRAVGERQIDVVDPFHRGSQPMFLRLALERVIAVGECRFARDD
jgi:hypothetical protein